MNDVTLSIDKSIVNPIVEAKVQEAVVAALGGPDSIVKGVIDQVLRTKVDSNGKPSSYSQSKSFMEWAVTSKIKEAVSDAIIEEVGKSADLIKESIIKELRTKRGASKVAKAMVDAMEGNWKNSWCTKIGIEFSENTDH